MCFCVQCGKVLLVFGAHDDYQMQNKNTKKEKLLLIVTWNMKHGEFFYNFFSQLFLGFRKHSNAHFQQDNNNRGKFVVWGKKLPIRLCFVRAFQFVFPWLHKKHSKVFLLFIIQFSISFFLFSSLTLSSLSFFGEQFVFFFFKEDKSKRHKQFLFFSFVVVYYAVSCYLYQNINFK